MRNINVVELTNNELKNLQNKGLDILREVISAINQMGLSYYCVGGTALGAIKYGGFIPWDDDIDIAMPREDYMLFLKDGSKFLPKNLKICSCFTEKNNCTCLTKVRDENTSFFDVETAKYDVSHGIFIDIFPIDGYRKNTLFDNIKKKINLGKIEFHKHAKKPFAKFVKCFICNVLGAFKPLNRCAIDVERILMKCKIDNSTSVYNRIMIFDKKIFGKPSIGKFENLEINLPQLIDDYLKICYGDIRLDPPKEKQVSHHFTLKVDFENSYKCFELTRKGFKKIC